MRAGKCTSLCLVGCRGLAKACEGSSITCCWHSVPPTLHHLPGVLCNAVDPIGNYFDSSGSPAGCCVPSGSPSNLLRGVRPHVSFSHGPRVPASAFPHHKEHIATCWGAFQYLHLHQTQCDAPHTWALQLLQQHCSV